MATVLVVVPARIGSTRLPGKMLADLAGRPLVVHTWERAVAAGLGPVVVATDEPRIVQAVQDAGGDARLTAAHHRSGTERMAELARERSEEFCLNLQGDEPLLDPAVPRDVIAALAADPLLDCATAACPITDEREWADPHAVKVVVGQDGRALYFSRSPIPHGAPASSPLRRLHLGLYAFRRQRLLEVAGWPSGALEQCEGLEQLRWLARGLRIGVVDVARQPGGVDTAEDLERLRAKLGSA